MGEPRTYNKKKSKTAAKQKGKERKEKKERKIKEHMNTPVLPKLKGNSRGQRQMGLYKGLIVLGKSKGQAKCQSFQSHCQ